MYTIQTSLQDRRPSAEDRRNALAALSHEGEGIMKQDVASSIASQCHAARSRKPARGFTLIELMLVMAVAGVLSGVAYPSFMGQLQKIRRSDALVSLIQVQAAQERWRSNNPSYGSLAEIVVAPTSGSGHYALQLTAHSENGYEVLATAQGVQSNDTQCRTMRLRIEGGNLVQSSGPDVVTDNASVANRQCWSL